jgi:hypothetical protein
MAADSELVEGRSNVQDELSVGIHVYQVVG